ncbi:hypothetical protein QP343_07955 [Lactobacillus jensenii]|jgi:hypothetical protein|uniref:Uncharacterized protein n=1 Tax=Lactobacillus jensenii TaxID=109790 RepID=A0A5N1I2Q8_LACJE|nr:hypothetical protein [Lactobacillus jensenii]EEQ68062.1 hypothetical protein LBJG_00490 [Lactobacillus jensenii 1153]ERJ43590.1 hypothetical protein N581_08820 [Lactobacillus jensenii MD IIE-70(2)]EEQ24580.1 hypothetical protein LACJE0001_1605 [Lactobacillus jensenii 269-3]EEX27583.1 hypothetical protein HMPREF0527_00635 [Lactobacillus jensenii SJ-7A-US]KAA9233214.1 hypothetical protein F6I36_08255 [Lactobacillus jensenii]
MVEKSQYFKNLIKVVVDNSESKDWKSAVDEWKIIDVVEDEKLEESCICGKEHLRYLFTIKNEENGRKLYPIGRLCIKKFERKELKDEVNIKEQLFKLLHAVEDNEFLQLSSEYFSRKLLHYLYEAGAFKATQWNDNDPKKTINFYVICLTKRRELKNRIRKQLLLFLVQ